MGFVVIDLASAVFADLPLSIFCFVTCHIRTKLQATLNTLCFSLLACPFTNKAIRKHKTLRVIGCPAKKGAFCAGIFSGWTGRAFPPKSFKKRHYYMCKCAYYVSTCKPHTVVRLFKGRWQVPTHYTFLF